MLLLNSMPETTAEHYRNKIAVYLQWYKKKAWIISRKLRKAILVQRYSLMATYLQSPAE
jgi:predicted phosphoadenosine phosphosulfate sulfurtransferase